MGDGRNAGSRVEVTHDAAANRFEAVVDGVTAELDYRRTGDRLVITHTGVPRPIGRRGIGGDLVAAAVELARDEGLTVVPQCWYAARWLDRHPDVAATVTVA